MRDRGASLSSTLLLDYDSLSRTLYATEMAAAGAAEPGTIMRASDDGAFERVLDSLAVAYLAIMPTRALLFLASAYQIVAYRLTSSFEST